MTNTVSTRTTELEAAVLGVVWRDGPCTPYAIRRDFLESPSPRWSGSAGAIYPLIRRLEGRGLVTSRAGSRGKRTQRNYRISRRGETCLRQWLQAPIARSEALLVHDPLRTRVLFLRALDAHAARSFVSDTLATLRQQIARLREDCRNRAKGDDLLATLSARNALLVTQARVRWLVEVSAALEVDR